MCCKCNCWLSTPDSFLSVFRSVTDCLCFCKQHHWVKTEIPLQFSFNSVSIIENFREMISISMYVPRYGTTNHSYVCIASNFGHIKILLGSPYALSNRLFPTNFVNVKMFDFFLLLLFQSLSWSSYVRSEESEAIESKCGSRRCWRISKKWVNSPRSIPTSPIPTSKGAWSKWESLWLH